MPDELKPGDEGYVAPANDETKPIWEQRGFESSEQMLKEFDKLKIELPENKTRKTALTASQQRVAELEAAEEERRVKNLSDKEKLEENFTAQQKENADLKTQIENQKKSALFDKTLFKHSVNKPALKTRMKLYAAEANGATWETEEELQAIFSGVDKDFEEELQSFNVTLAAPGDNHGANDHQETKYDDDYFKNFHKKKT